MKNQESLEEWLREVSYMRDGEQNSEDTESTSSRRKQNKNLSKSIKKTQNKIKSHFLQCYS